MSFALFLLHTVGWLVKGRSPIVFKTFEKHLPPIPSKITDFTTIFKYLHYFQDLAGAENMKYVNVILDMGAAINAYKVLWNYPAEFGNVIIHPGDFHMMKENFQVTFVNILNFRKSNNSCRYYISPILTILRLTKILNRQLASFSATGNFLHVNYLRKNSFFASSGIFCFSLHFFFKNRIC